MLDACERRMRSSIISKIRSARFLSSETSTLPFLVQRMHSSIQEISSDAL